MPGAEYCSQSFPSSYLTIAAFSKHGFDAKSNGMKLSKSADSAIYKKHKFSSVACHIDDDLTNLSWLHQNPSSFILASSSSVSPTASPIKNVTENAIDETENELDDKVIDEDILYDQVLGALQSQNGSLLSASLSKLLPYNGPHSRWESFLLPSFDEESFQKYDPIKDTDIRQPFSNTCLIFLAIESSPSKMLQVKEIYTWISKNFPYYRNSTSSGWKNSIRHHLSTSKHFKKIDPFLFAVPGDISSRNLLWIIDPIQRPALLQSLSRLPLNPSCTRINELKSDIDTRYKQAVAVVTYMMTNKLETPSVETVESRKALYGLRTCAIPNCCLTTDTLSWADFHSLPTSEGTKSAWMSALYSHFGSSIELDPSMQICSRHFKTRDFYDLSCGGSWWLVLREDAVPSFFEPASTKNIGRRSQVMGNKRSSGVDTRTRLKRSKKRVRDTPFSVTNPVEDDLKFAATALLAFKNSSSSNYSNSWSEGMLKAMKKTYSQRKKRKMSGFLSERASPELGRNESMNSMRDSTAGVPSPVDSSCSESSVDHSYIVGSVNNTSENSVPSSGIDQQVPLNNPPFKTKLYDRKDKEESKFEAAGALLDLANQIFE